jgi:outer membrane immunogenic protein
MLIKHRIGVRIMSKLRVALAALAVAVASPAAAADLARPYYGNAQAVQPSMIPGFVWTGLYAGAQLGYNWSTIDWRETPDFSANGVSGGVHLGYNWQVGQFVYGLEGQLNWADADGSKGCWTNGICSGDINWTGDVRARLGYAFDRAHLFGAAGIAYASVKTRDSFTISGTPPVTMTSSGDASLLGFTLGVGGEYAVTQNIVAGVEYKYTWYGTDNVTPTITGADLSTGLLQARLSYKF